MDLMKGGWITKRSGCSGLRGEALYWNPRHVDLAIDVVKD